MAAPSNGQEREAIRFLPPAAFKELPASIVLKLEARGCAVPQVDAFFTKGPTNVIRGEFVRAKQVDWAVLCSTRGNSTILFFWGKPTVCPSKLSKANDSSYLQPLADKGVGYSRGIHSVSGADLAGYASPPNPGLMKHQGIEDAFEGKGSSVYYCIDGQWKIVAGAD
jgi:hypothetical protein